MPSFLYVFLSSIGCVFLGMALTWNTSPIFALLRLNPLTEIFITLVIIPVPTLFLTVKAIRGKTWSLSVIAVSAVMATFHLVATELPVGFYTWLIGLTFCGIAFYCHVRVINRALKIQAEEASHSGETN